MGDKLRSEIQKPVKNTLLSGAGHGFPFETFRGSSLLVPVSQDSPSVLDDDVGEPDKFEVQNSSKSETTFNPLSELIGSAPADSKGPQQETENQTNPSRQGYIGIFSSFFGGGQAKPDTDSFNQPKVSDQQSNSSISSTPRSYSPYVHVPNIQSYSPVLQVPTVTTSPNVTTNIPLTASPDDGATFSVPLTGPAPPGPGLEGSSFGADEFVPLTSAPPPQPSALTGDSIFNTSNQTHFDPVSSGELNTSIRFYNPSAAPSTFHGGQPLPPDNSCLTQPYFSPPQPSFSSPPFEHQAGPPPISNAPISAPPLTSGGFSKNYRLGQQKKLAYAPIPGLTSNTSVATILQPSDTFSNPPPVSSLPSIFNPTSSQPQTALESSTNSDVSDQPNAPKDTGYGSAASTPRPDNRPPSLPPSNVPAFPPGSTFAKSETSDAPQSATPWNIMTSRQYYPPATSSTSPFPAPPLASSQFPPPVSHSQASSVFDSSTAFQPPDPVSTTITASPPPSTSALFGRPDSTPNSAFPLQPHLQFPPEVSQPLDSIQLPASVSSSEFPPPPSSIPFGSLSQYPPPSLPTTLTQPPPFSTPSTYPSAPPLSVGSQFSPPPAATTLPTQLPPPVSTPPAIPPASHPPAVPIQSPSGFPASVASGNIAPPPASGFFPFSQSQNPFSIQKQAPQSSPSPNQPPPPQVSTPSSIPMATFPTPVPPQSPPEPSSSVTPVAPPPSSSYFSTPQSQNQYSLQKQTRPNFASAPSPSSFFNSNIPPSAADSPKPPTFFSPISNANFNPSPKEAPSVPVVNPIPVHPSSSPLAMPRAEPPATLNVVNDPDSSLPSSVIPPSFNKLASMGQPGVVYRPAYHHWFVRRDDETKELWEPFSMTDSLALEAAHNSTELNKETVVATDGGRFDVNVLQRRRYPVYWSEEPKEVRRCSWYYRSSTESRFRPYDEKTAEFLEVEYKNTVTNNSWHRKVELRSGEYFVFNAPSTVAHFLNTSPSPDSWEAGNDLQNHSQSRPRIVKRGVVDDFEIDDGESPVVDHLLFIAHGIGSVCDFKLRTIEKAVNDFRSVAHQLVKSHFRSSVEEGTVSRIEVLPVSWHYNLHGDTTGVDKKLQTITLKSIPRLRNFTNDTLLDILYFTSPVYCQNIVEKVGNDINSLYEKFKLRNPSFTGGVSLCGHSLGSVILFDILCHQKPVTPLAENTSELTLKSEDSVNNIDRSSPATVPGTLNRRLSRNVSYVVGPAGTGQPFVTYPQLDFSPVAFFAMGSPIGMFVTVRGIDSLGLDFRLPTCPGFFNIFHPFDPVAYRIEALINPELGELRPVLIPHHKGRKRMHLELKEKMAKVGADLKQRIVDSVRTTWNTVYQLTTFGRADDSLEQEVDNVIQKQLERQRSESVGACPSEYEDITADVGCVNRGRRLDYVLQETPLQSFNEYVSALTSHAIYWDSEDTALLILKEIYGTMGIAPDNQVGASHGLSDDFTPPSPASQSVNWNFDSNISSPVESLANINLSGDIRSSQSFFENLQ